jgi:hypothetical protein
MQFFYIEIVSLKCWNLKKLQGRGKISKLVETQVELLGSG